MNDIEIKQLEFNQDLVQLVNRILDQNQQLIELSNRIIETNRRVLDAFELPKFQPITMSDAAKYFKK